MSSFAHAGQHVTRRRAAGQTGIVSILSAAFIACGGSSREKRIVEIPAPDAAGGSGGIPDGSGGMGGTQRDASIDSAPVDSGVTGCSQADLADGELELITVGLTCRAADGDASRPWLSPDGRVVFYQSDAGDLVEGDLNGTDDVFVFDRGSRKLERVSVTSSGGPTNSASFEPVASDDGRHVVFTSMATNVTAGAPEGIRVYVRDRNAGLTALLPATYACAYAPRISGNGSLVVWRVVPDCRGRADPEDVFGAFLFDRGTGRAEPLGEADGSDNYSPAISRNGRWLAWGTRPALTRGQATSQIKLLDRSSGEVQTLPVSPAFNVPAIALSENAEVVAYANNGNLYRYERASAQLTLVSKNARGEAGDGVGHEVVTSSDGRQLVFLSTASNLVDGDTNGVADVFLFDAETGGLRRVNLAGDGRQADDESRTPAISADGKVVAFASKARNLLPAATSGNWQIYSVRVGE